VSLPTTSTDILMVGRREGTMRPLPKYRAADNVGAQVLAFSWLKAHHNQLQLYFRAVV